MAEKKYRWRHQKMREALLPAAYGMPCPFCGGLMLPGQSLDLDHMPGQESYRGMAHAKCNRRDGARRGNAIRKWKRQRRSTIFP
jgi:hypothetical protein